MDCLVHFRLVCYGSGLPKPRPVYSDSGILLQLVDKGDNEIIVNITRPKTVVRNSRVSPNKFISLTIVTIIIGDNRFWPNNVTFQ